MGFFMDFNEYNKIDLMRIYEKTQPLDIFNARRAWRVSFMFDRMDLFDSAILLAMVSKDVADWSAIFNISADVDVASISEYRREWPDTSYLRALGES